MPDPVIRRAVLSDLPYLYEICLKTGDAGKDASALFYDPFIIGQYYAAPYPVSPDGICFVVESEFRPQGYIVATPDTGAFNRWMEDVWLPPLRERYPRPFPPERIRTEEEGRILALFHECHYPKDSAPPPWFKDYPAHLHIDLLSSLQGKGLGRRLINRLCEELVRLGVPGVHLGVGAKNTGAIAFYRGTGFTVLQEADWGLTMGKETT
jgi:GNAT superfamily N-acetyltransferase